MTTRTTDLVVGWKFPGSHRLQEQSEGIHSYRQKLNHRLQSGQRWLDLIDGYGLGILALYPVRDNSDPSYMLSNATVQDMEDFDFQCMFNCLERSKGKYLRKLCRIVEPFLRKWIMKKSEDGGLRVKIELDKALDAFRLEPYRARNTRILFVFWRNR
jgi:hypothetical protein